MKKTFRVKTFMNGGSQAVRIPAIARFSGDQVLLTYDTETTTITLEAIPEEPNLLKVLEKWASGPSIPDEVWAEFDSKLADLRKPIPVEDAIASAKEL